MLSVLNEVQHEHFYEGLGVPAAKAYTRCYDAIVSESRKVYPALEFVGPELGPIKWDKEHTTDFLGYFLDPHNHADGKAPNQISFHCKIDADAFIDLIGLACRLANLKSLAIADPNPTLCGQRTTPEDSSPYFQYLDCWLQNEVAAVEKIRQRVAPETGV